MSHTHDHGHIPSNYNKAFILGIVLNIIFVLIEGVYGYVSHSLALLADAGHNLSDVASLGLAFLATILARRHSTPRFTYGLRGSSILAAVFNAVLVLTAILIIAFEAVQRLYSPSVVGGSTVIVIATIGILVNAATALLFMSGRKKDLNLRGAFLHMATDAVVSLGVVIAGIGILLTGWNWLDPVISLGIVAVIGVSTWSLLKESIAMALQAVPSNLEISRVKEAILAIKNVKSVHHIHIWNLSTTETALTVHVVVNDLQNSEQVLTAINTMLHDKFEITHPTIQLETAGMESKGL